MKKIIVSDLDGTLLIYNERSVSISDKNVSKIKLWQEKNYFTIATGRNAFEVIDILKNANLKPNTYLICNNGAIIYDYYENKVIYEEKMPVNFTLAICEYYYNNDIGHLGISSSEGGFGVSFKMDKSKYQEIINVVKKDKVNKLGQYFKGYDIKPTIKYLKGLVEIEKVDLVFSSDTYLDIQPKGTSKGKALNELKRLVPNSKIYAIGDYLNDYEMLINADVSFAPSNSAKEIKEIANYLVGHHNDDAVAEMIDKIIEEEL